MSSGSSAGMKVFTKVSRVCGRNVIRSCSILAVIILIIAVIPMTKLTFVREHNSEGGVTRIPQTFLPGVRMDLPRDLERIISRGSRRLRTGFANALSRAEFLNLSKSQSKVRVRIRKSVVVMEFKQMLIDSSCA